MKKKLLVVIISFIGIFNSIYSQNNTQIIVPCENQLTFVDNNQTFIYLERDSVYVSVGFSNHRNGDFIFDVTIDNQGSDTLDFDPGQIYLFRYAHDTLAEQKAYHPLDAHLILDSIDSSIEKRETKVKNINVFSILLGVLYISAEIAGAAGDMDFSTMEAIRVTHEIAQTGLDIGRYNNEDKLYDLSFAGDYWLNGVFQRVLVLPHSFESGNIHFIVEKSDVLKIDIPIGEHIFRYEFEEVDYNKIQEIEQH